MKAGSGSFGLGCWCVRSRPRTEDGRVGDAAPTPGDGEDGGLGLGASSGGWFDTGRRVRPPGSPRTVTAAGLVA